jgi:cysteine desulfurase
MIYFDNAASTPVNPVVINVMSEYHAELHGNPSAIHGYGRKARVVLEQSRRTIAALIHALPSEVVFTSGGTEANNTILWGCCKDLSKKDFISSRLEHPSVLHTLEVLMKYFGIRVHFLHHDIFGHVELDHLEQTLKLLPNAVVCLMHANNEIGNLLPVKDVAGLCAKYGALFHSDTVQTIGKYDIDMSKLPFDFAVGSAHKFYGPKGVGFMYLRKGNSPGSFITGGGQERNMRAGTENISGIAGMAKALEVVTETLEADRLYIDGLKAYLIASLKEAVPSIRFNGDAEKHSLYSIINILLPNSVDHDMLVPRFDMAGICLSSGSACSSGSAVGSHVLKALGRAPEDPSVRVSLSRHNTVSEVKKLVDVIRTMCQSDCHE